MKLGGITITVINDVSSGDPTGYDGVGDPIYGAPSLTVVNNCDIQQHNTRREISTTDVTWSRWRLFAPSHAPLQTTSIIAVGVITQWPLEEGVTTETFLVDGDPASWNSRNGMLHHFECYLREWTG